MSDYSCGDNGLLCPGQTIATLLGATCCVRLVTLLRHVATCWVFLAQIGQQHPTCRNTPQRGGQTHTTCYAQQCCDMLRCSMLRSFGRGLRQQYPTSQQWPNARNQHVAPDNVAICCDRLAGALRSRSAEVMHTHHNIRA